MYKEHKIAVVIPAYNEGELISETLAGMPDWLDTLYVVHDGGSDDTLPRIREQMKLDPRIVLIDHEVNKGLGQTLIDGYLASAASDNDITVIMAGDQLWIGLQYFKQRMSFWKRMGLQMTAV